MNYIKEYQDKKVFIVTKNNMKYSGFVISVDDLFLVLLDKYNKKVTFALGEISQIGEMRE